MPWDDNIFPLLIVTASGGFTGFFIYAPGPGKGNLIVAEAAAAGTDPYGNAFPAGSNFGKWSAATGVLQQHFGINPGGDIFLGNAAGLVIFQGRAIDGSFYWYNNSGQGLGNLVLVYSPVAGTDPAGNNYAAGFSINGNINIFGAAIAIQFETLHPSSIVVETWQVVGTATPFLNSFSAGGTAPRYQLEGMNGTRVRLSGAVNTGAVNAASTPMFNLPAGYRPSRALAAVTPNNIAAAVLGQAIVQVNPSGDVWCVPASTAGKFLLLDNVCVELD